MKVTVRLLSGADHLSQILTGFQMLSRENKLTLDILDCRKDSPVYQEAFLEAQVNGIRILFDLMDGYWYNRPETVFPLYHSADIVFKRSFSSVKNSEVFGAFSEKIHPLGFNYHVFCPGSPLIGTTSKIGFLKKRIKGVTCYVSDYEARMTHVSARPRILFITSPLGPGRTSCSNGFGARPPVGRNQRNADAARTKAARRISGAVYRRHSGQPVCANAVS